jgi:thioredoxin reductase (NADPH)
VTETARSTLLSSAANAALMFPVLSSAQIARIASHGVIRPITRGEVLIDSGQTNVPFFVLKAGEIEVIRPSAPDEILVAIVGPAQFTDDISMILSRPAQKRLRVNDSGEVVQLTRDQMHALIQTDAEISEVLMRALIHRRVALVAQGIGDVLLIGSVGADCVMNC